MTLYYENDGITLYHADCREILPQIGPVDLVLTDPPYGISSEVKIARGKNSMKFRGPDISHDFGAWDKFSDLEDFFDFTTSWVNLVDNALRPGGMFISYFDRDKVNFLSHYLQGKDYKVKGYFADCKTNPVPQARKVTWMSGWEIAGMWQKPGGELTCNWQLGQHKDWGMRPIVAGKERTKHPTQKPLSVLLDFVAYWSNKGDLILDPFCGSGTTLRAAKDLGRRAIGIEAEEEYCQIAKNRLGQGVFSF